MEGVVRVKMTGLVLVAMLCGSFSPVCLAQEEGYFSQMGQALVRGGKNIVSFPWEIPQRSVVMTKRTMETTAFSGTQRVLWTGRSGL